MIQRYETWTLQPTQLGASVPAAELSRWVEVAVLRGGGAGVSAGLGLQRC